MFNAYSSFDYLEKKRSDPKFSVGHGSPLAIMGGVTVHTTTVVDWKKKTVVLKNDLFYPKLFFNLISVIPCRNDYVKVTFDSSNNGW